MSNLLSGMYPAANAIDGVVSSLAASQSAQTVNQWLSVQMPAGSTTRNVAVYNRADGAIYENWLSPYEIWLGASPGALTHACGGPRTLPTPAGLGPFATPCGDRSDLPYVTLLLRSGTLRFLTVGEIKVYGLVPGALVVSSPPPPPPPLPPPPMPPPPPFPPPPPLPPPPLPPPSPTSPTCPAALSTCDLQPEHEGRQCVCNLVWTAECGDQPVGTRLHCE